MDQTAIDRFEELMEGNTDDPKVQYELGLCYLHGEGVAQDGQKADFWLRRAADQGLEEAIALLDSAQPTAQVEEITEATLPDWCVLAEKGDPDAQYLVAEYFQRNQIPGTEADMERYLSQAVAQGHPKACYELAMRRLREGRAQEAVQLLRNAVDCGLPEAAEQMGICYANGIGMEMDHTEAEQYFIRAAQNGSGESMLNLAVRYGAGYGVEQSMVKAYNWLKHAQDAGLENAKEQFDLRVEETRRRKEREDALRAEEARRIAEQKRQAEEKARLEAEQKRLEEEEQSRQLQVRQKKWKNYQWLGEAMIVIALFSEVVSFLFGMGHSYLLLSLQHIGLGYLFALCAAIAPSLVHAGIGILQWTPEEMQEPIVKDNMKYALAIQAATWGGFVLDFFRNLNPLGILKIIILLLILVVANYGAYTALPAYLITLKPQE